MKVEKSIFSPIISIKSKPTLAKSYNFCIIEQTFTWRVSQGELSMYAVGNVINFLLEKSPNGNLVDPREAIKRAFELADAKGMIAGGSITEVLGRNANARHLFHGWFELNLLQIQVAIDSSQGKPSVNLLTVVILVWGVNIPGSIYRHVREWKPEAFLHATMEELGKLGIKPKGVVFYVGDSSKETPGVGTAGE